MEEKNIAYRLGELAGEMRGIGKSILDLNEKFDKFVDHCDDSRANCVAVKTLPLLETRVNTLENNATVQQLTRMQLVKIVTIAGTIASGIIGALYSLYQFLQALGKA